MGDDARSAVGTTADAFPTGLLDALLATSGARVLLVDRSGRARWASPALRSLLDGGEPADLLHPGDREDVRATFRRLLASRAATADCRGRVRGPDGYDDVRIHLLDALDDPQVGAVVMTFGSPATDLDPAALVHRADHDGLTGLANRALLVRTLGGSGPLAVLFVDLDGFKAVNDTYGHATGDQLLVAVAERLRRAVRPGDTVGRLGGDEFVVVAAGVADEAVAGEIALRAQIALAQPYHVSGRTVRLTASIGVALGEGGDGGATLLDRADTAMYEAKRAGGARSEMHHEGLLGDRVRRLDAAETLRVVLDAGDLAVAYTPVVTLADEVVVGRLAALHLLDNRGVVVGSLAEGSAAAEAAERSGLAVSVGAGLIDAACAEAAATTGTGPVWVPVTATQLRQGRLARVVTASLERHGARPHTLVIELPEAVVAHGGAAVWRTITDLRALGVGLALTGFGSGGASPSVVRRAAPDVVVLDAAHTAAVGTPAGDPAVVAALVGLGRALGAHPAAEGVERAEQVAALRDIGCAMASGRWWASGSPTAARLAPSVARGAQATVIAVAGTPDVDLRGT